MLYKSFKSCMKAEEKVNVKRFLETGILKHALHGIKDILCLSVLDKSLGILSFSSLDRTLILWH